MRRISAALILLGILIGATTTAEARPWQRWRGSGGWGPGSRYHRLYNVDTVRTVVGVVVSVDRVWGGPGMSAGIRLILRTGDRRTVRILLGPEWYITRLDTPLRRGDSVEIRGSLVSLDGDDVILAAIVRKGNLSLVLRDENGFPLWAGWRGRM